MRLRSKLVLTATGLVFAIVSVISLVFLGELMRQRIQHTADTNEVLAHEVLLVTRDAVEHLQVIVRPGESTEDAVHAAVLDALRSSNSLSQVMTAIIRYSNLVQDVSVTDAHGFTLVSTDEDM